MIMIMIIAVSHNDRGTIVAVHAIEVTRYIEGHHIPKLQWTLIRNPVTNDFIDRGTHALGKAIVIERRRIRPGLNDGVVDDRVNVVCRHGANMRMRIRSHPTRYIQPLAR